MRVLRLPLAFVFTALLVAGSSSWLPPLGGRIAQAQSAGSATTAFVGATIIDGTDRAPVQDGVLVVSGGKITSVGSSSSVRPPAGARTVDLKGKTVVPGFINAHGHVNDVKGLQTGPQFYTEENVLAQLRLYARYGVTTVFSLGGDGDVGFKFRDSQNTPTLDRARIFVAGPVIVGDTPAEARAMTEKAAAMKPNYLDDAKGLLKAGADLVAHSIRDKPVDAEVIGLLKKRDTCVIPTLMREVSTFVYEDEPAFFKDPFFLKAFSNRALL